MAKTCEGAEIAKPEIANSLRTLTPQPAAKMPQMSREESWNSLHHSEASGDNADEGYSDVSMEDEDGPENGDERSATASPTFPTISDVHRALHPLQATADRVGKQVERFAENLDRLSVRNQRRTSKDCRHVISLVNAYKKIAIDTVLHLGSMHESERRKELSKTTRRRLRSSSGRSTPKPAGGEDGGDEDLMTTVEDLKRWEQEEQTWELLSLMLQVQHPIPESERAKVGADLLRPNKTSQIHRYSSEKDVWDNFLALDDEAWERNTVVQWLQTCANRSGQDIEQVVEELESGADRGSGLWAHSWLFTKEAIKGQKRLRSWPKALEPNDPGLDASLLNSEKTKALVTQLDPDAITRQNRALEKQDLYFERAMWLGCWEMVRRGKDWDYVRNWCQERVEGWRATAMRGDPRSLLYNNSSATSWQSRALWRQTCALAAKDGGIDEYEKAVYGVLSGYLPSVLKVSRCWDDYLFAQYNSDLLHSFDDHVQTSFADRESTALKKKQSSFKFSAFGGQSVQPGDKIVEKMKQFEATKEEARDPFKMLQGSLIGKSFADFLYTHGVRLAEAINAKGRSQIIPLMNVRISEDYVTAPISMDDHDYLRIITHIIFIFQDLGFDFGDKPRRQAMENIVVAYVDYLSKAGKQQLLPLYASRLSTARSWYCLGRQLPSIQEHGERETLMQLMKQYDINVYGVLSSHMQSVIRDALPKKDSSIRYPNLRILEDNRIDAMGLRPIKANFIGKVMADDQRDLVHGFEWYLLLEGHWEETMTAGVAIYKFLIRESQHMLHSLIPETNTTISTGSHGLAAARMLLQTVTFTDISLAKTDSILGRSLDLSKSEDVINNEAGSGRTTRNTRSHLSSSQRRRRSTSVRRVRSERELLLDDGDTFRAFENLFAALNALEEWKDVVDEGQK